MRKVAKPWGHELIWAEVVNRYAGKILVIEKGHRLSLQYHKRKHESVYVLEGPLSLRLGTRVRTVPAGKAFTVRPGTLHRFEAKGKRVVLIEVSTNAPSDLGDVVRLEDDYGRKGA